MCKIEVQTTVEAKRFGALMTGAHSDGRELEVVCCLLSQALCNVALLQFCPSAKPIIVMSKCRANESWTMSMRRPRLLL
jgi:hypothetical protein